jgi:hypothetical protein
MKRKYLAAVTTAALLGLLAFALSTRVTAAPAHKSQNGWSVVEKGGTESYQVPGSKVKLRVRKGDVATVLLDVASWFDRNVEDIDAGADDWGWAVRPIEGSSTYSNHASGTAIDLNATRHPMGVATAKNLTKAQIADVHARLKDRWKNVVRWGGDYTGRPDAMHFEINKDAAAVKGVADAIRRPTPTTKPATTRPPATPTTRGPAGPGTPTTAAPTTAAPTTAAPTTVAPPPTVGGEEEGREEMGPVEPQAPTEAPLTPVAAEAPVPVVVRPAFTG